MNLWRGVLTAGLLLAVVGCGEGAPDDSKVLVSLTDQDHRADLRGGCRGGRRVSRRRLTRCARRPPTARCKPRTRRGATARGAWLRSAAMAFGPVMDRRSGGLIDWSPIDRRANRADAGRAPRDDRGRGAEHVGLHAARLRGDRVPRVRRGRRVPAVRLRLAALRLPARARRRHCVRNRRHRRGVDGVAERRPRLPGLSHRTVVELDARERGGRRGGPDAGLPHSHAHGLATGGCAWGCGAAVPTLRPSPAARVATDWPICARRCWACATCIWESPSNDGFGVSHMVAPLSTAADERMRSLFADAVGSGGRRGRSPARLRGGPTGASAGGLRPAHGACAAR